MYLQALATAVPAASYTQEECWEILQRSPAKQRLNHRSLMVVQTVLKGESGVEKRHFAVPDVDRVFDLSSDELNAAFCSSAPPLAGRALSAGLEKLGAKPQEIDALFICTCTGYLCPGLSSYVSEALGLRSDVFALDLVGQGCGGAIPTLRAAAAYCAANPDALVATIAVEVCSAAFYLDDDIGVLVSACIFGDGAAAALWRGKDVVKNGLKIGGFQSLHLPESRDLLRFEQRDGKLRNRLDVTVPKLAARSVKQLYDETVAGKPVAKVVAHGGGKTVIEAVEHALGGTPLASSRDVLRRYGNMSSPSVLFALEHALEKGAPQTGGDWWLVSFGAGFTAHSCRLERIAAPVL